MPGQNPLCLGQKHLGMTQAGSGVWWPHRGLGQPFPAAAFLSPAALGSHTHTLGVSLVCWAPRGLGDTGGVPDRDRSSARHREDSGLAESQLCWALAQEFTLAPVFLLGCPFPAQCSEIHLFHWGLSWTLVIFQISVKIEPRPFFPILLCGWNDDVRAEYLGSPHSLPQNRNQLIRGAGRLITAQRALLFIPKDLVNQQSWKRK